MALNLKKKKNIVQKIHEIAKISISAIIANTKNISSNIINKLRKQGRKQKILIYMVKNTLLKKSLKNTTLEKLNSNLHGPTLIAFSSTDPNDIAKLFNKFSKKNKNFKITTIILNKKILSKKEIINLINLPTKKESIILFIATIKHATIEKILFILLALKQKKENNNKIKIVS